MAQQRQELKNKLDARVEAARTWARRVKAELAVLPDTLEKLREGATSFQAVGQRLEATSASLEELTDLYGRTLGASGPALELGRRGAPGAAGQAARATRPAAPDLLTATVDDLQRTMDALAAMNPFWPTTSPATGDEGGQEASAAEGLTARRSVAAGRLRRRAPEGAAPPVRAPRRGGRSRCRATAAGRAAPRTAPCVRATRASGPGQHGDAGTGEHERHDRLALVGLDRDPRRARRSRRTPASSRSRVDVPTGWLTSGSAASAASGRRRGGFAPGREGGHELLAARAGGSRCARRPPAPP